MPDGPPTDNGLAALAGALMQSRQTVLPKRLAASGPSAGELGMMLDAAATAPDHGQLLPWRFVQVPAAARAGLAEVFGAALIERDAGAMAEQVAQARAKAHSAPLLLLFIVDGVCGDADIDLFERTLSAGRAVQNLLLMATALSYGSALTSGKALKSTTLRALFGLAPGEHALCFVSIGTAQSRRKSRARPVPGDFVTRLLVGAEPA